MGLIVFFSFVLDYIFGDPQNLWHPVCGIGKIIEKSEGTIRKVLPNTNGFQVFGGIILFFTVTFLSFLIPFVILYSAAEIHFVLYYFICVVFCTQIFAANSLRKETMKIFFALKENDIEKSRKYLSYVVGRDTAELNREEIIKAAVETVAENTTDGVTAPLIYMLLGGPPLGFMYKAVNTLDSMVGYKNDRYLYFGRFSAKMDDIFNFVPARFTAFVMIFSAWILKLDYKNAVKVFIRDRNKHKSPNAGQTESVFAGALGIQLGGNAYYFSRMYEKALLGNDTRKPAAEDIVSACKIMYLTSFAATVFLCGIAIAAEVIL